MLTPAKINLGLEILRRRDDGYHEINSLFLPIALYDELTFELNEGGIVFRCDTLPDDGTNLCVRAALALQTQFAIADRGVTITLKKNIPTGAGLGGGSSDAACTLNALNTLWELNASPAELYILAKSLGADVPFFLDPKPAIVQGIGDEITPLPFTPELNILLVCPDIHINTAWAYSQVKLQADKQPAKLYNTLNSRNSLTLVENDFEQFIFPHHPQLAQIQQDLLTLGAFHAAMSGSGSAMFGLFYTREKAEIASKYLTVQPVKCFLL